MRVPILVAEALEVVTDPLLPILRPLGRGPVTGVLAAMAQALARPETPARLPEWLLDHQRPPVRQLLAMLSANGGALLASPVGSGKTYQALATAGALGSRGPAIVLVPAVLVSQWRRTAARLGVPITIWSHERLSHGTLPERLLRSTDRALVIIDESHHFRNPASHRYRHLAPALLGHPVLMLSATPVVNRLSDLSHQLLLGIRDDALVSFGVTSLRAHFAGASAVHPAVAVLIVTAPGTSIGKPRRRSRRAGAEPSAGPLAVMSGAIDSLRLSRAPAVAGLIRVVLYRALASSPAALAVALRRYRGLLLHAGEALAGGRILDRARLRRFIGPEADQLIMWELLPAASGTTDLHLADLRPIETLLEQVSAAARVPDEKCRTLRIRLASGKRTIVFTGAQGTVRYLRDHLGSSIAWCTGQAAGIGVTRLPRDAVLGWFGPGARIGGPRVLVTTDVAAEGLDLQGAEQVVHYDLPWTSVRLDQRDGRAIRLGSRHSQVEVVRFDPPALLADRLKQVSILARKRSLPRRAALAGTAARTWQWRDQVARATGEWGCVGHWAAVAGEPRGMLAGFTIVVSEPNGSSRDLASALGWMDPEGRWFEQPEIVDRALRAVACKPEIVKASETHLTRALRQLCPIIRSRLETIRAARWARPALGGGAGRLVERLNRLSAGAARAREWSRLLLIERGLHFASRGHTAGEEHQVQVLLALPDGRLWRQLERWPPPSPDWLPRVRLNGLIVFAPDDGILSD